MISLFDSLLVQVEPTLRMLRWEWYGSLTYSGFQTAFTQLISCSEEHTITHWLADTSLMPPVGTDEQAWLSEVWLAQFVPLQVRHIALMLPLGLHNQLVVENVLTDGARQVRAEVQFFSDIPAALDWLTPATYTLHGLEEEWTEGQNQLQAYSGKMPFTLGL